MVLGASTVFNPKIGEFTLPPAFALNRAVQACRLRAFMKLAAAALVWLTGLLTVSAQSALGKLERMPLFGVDYIRLTDWAAASHFQILRTGKIEDVRLTAPGSKLVLTRNGDTLVPLTDRPVIARQRDAELFVSLHFNAVLTDKDLVKGMEAYCLTPAGAGSTNARGESGDTSACAGNRFDAKNML